MATAQNRAETLGPAERIINALLAYTDHLYHGRPGLVCADNRFNVGVRWEPVTHKVEEGVKVVYKVEKIGKKTRKTRLGVLRDDGKVANGTVVVGEYREAGLFPEVAAWMYRNVVEVWKLDNEFAARWASYAFPQDHRDLKVVLGAFLLCQSRKGDPVVENGKTLFHDEDYRDVGEAMCLLYRKDGKDLNPKMLLRVHELLNLDCVAAINRELGFGKSARKPFYGRWPKAVEKWLRFREHNPEMLAGLMKAGFRQTVMDLCERVGYKPDTAAFFETLRWKQKQAKQGHRTIAIGAAVKAAESWEGWTEGDICQHIVKEKPDWKRIVGLLPKEIGVTRAIMAAAIEAKSLSDKDLIILTPTLESLGLLEVQDVRARWESATKNAEDTRAANIAKNVQSQAVKDKLQEAADTAMQKAVVEVMRNIRLYLMVDTSGSMTESTPLAKFLLGQFVQAFPLDHLHVSVFNTSGKELTIRHPSAAGVENALTGITPGGGTDYGAGIRALQHHKPAADEDAIMMFVGDQGDQRGSFMQDVERSGLHPVAFGMLFIETGDSAYRAVERTAAELHIPCFSIDQKTFADPYAIPRTLKALIASAPVGKLPGATTPRLTLVDQILKTELLKRPYWA